MKYNNHIPEQQLIDYALGSLTIDRQEPISRHVKHCEKCRTELHNWQQVLTEEADHRPSLAIKERLMESVEQSQKPNKTKRKPVLIFAMASITAVLCLIIGLYTNSYFNQPSVEVAHNADILKKDLQSYPETIQMPIKPLTNFDEISGNVWLNNISEELLLEVDGLATLENGAYQLWIIYDNDTIERELLLIQNGSSQILFKGKDINRLKMIKASVEPIGGSMEQTGSDTFIVNLKK